MSLQLEVEFCYKLLPLMEASSKSTVFSPISILNSLSMILGGAKENTAIQIAQLIGKDKTEKQIMEYYSDFSRSHKVVENAITNTIDIHCRKSPNCEDDISNINMANGIFVSKNISIIPEYKKLIKENFDGQIETINFEENEKAAEKINAFLEDKTNKMIKEIISSEDLTTETSLILINAINFIGFWETPFDDREPWTFNSIPPREIPMMDKTIKDEDEWNYQEGNNWRALGLPYKNRRAWMYIVLPNQEDGLSNLLKTFNFSLFTEITKREKAKKMTVVIPIIEISTTLDLEEKLKELGITDVFSNDNCNLCGMVEKSIKIEKAIHKAVIKVDERGTIVSAATGFQMNARSMPPTFYATHPFLYFITSVNDSEMADPKNILFMGTFC